MCPGLTHHCYKWGRRLYKTARFTRPAQLLGYVQDHVNLYSLDKEKCCCHIIWSYKKTNFFHDKQKTLLNGRKREDHVLPSFCNLFQYSVCWLILLEWTLDGLEWSYEASGSVYCGTTSEREHGLKPMGHCFLLWWLVELVLSWLCHLSKILYSVGLSNTAVRRLVEAWCPPTSWCPSMLYWVCQRLFKADKCIGAVAEISYYWRGTRHT